MKAYPNDVNFVYKQFPLPATMHPNAMPAAKSAAAAGRQGKFWEMHDIMFQNNRELGFDKLKEYAGKVGLDVARWEKDYNSPEVEQENKLGARAFQQVLGKSHVDGRAQVNGPVEAAGQRLARVAERPDYKWRFVAIDDPKQQNAFCLPGGKVAVYTGIFPIAESTNGLAVVLGHEIAHALARHGAERISQGLVAQAGGSLLGTWLGGGPGTDTILAAYGLGAQLGVLLPYSRTQESEADHIGLLLMAPAGYDPRGALAFG